MFDFGWVLLFKNTLVLSVPLLLAAMGGLISERSGVMNIALEGKMLTSACITAIVATSTHSAFLGLMIGLFSAVLLGLLHGMLTQSFRINHIVSGMALNAIAIGATSFLDKRFSDPTRSGDIPSFSSLSYILLSLLLPLLIAVYFKFTKGGLRLLAIGNDPDKARQVGLNPVNIRYLAMAFTGLFCGLSGVMIVTNAGRFSDNMTAGRGFIALASVILGSWRPIPTGIACLAFGMFSTLDLQLQGTKVFGVLLPSQFWNSLPYLATIIAMGGLLGKSKVPSGIGKD